MGRPRVSMWPVRTTGGVMLATWQTFMQDDVISHLPTKLQHPVEILIYFAILGAMAVIPLLLRLGWAVASTDLDDQR